MKYLVLFCLITLGLLSPVAEVKSDTKVKIDTKVEGDSTTTTKTTETTTTTTVVEVITQTTEIKNSLDIEYNKLYLLLVKYQADYEELKVKVAGFLALHQKYELMIAESMKILNDWKKDAMALKLKIQAEESMITSLAYSEWTTALNTVQITIKKITEEGSITSRKFEYEILKLKEIIAKLEAEIMIIVGQITRTNELIASLKMSIGVIEITIGKSERYIIQLKQELSILVAKKDKNTVDQQGVLSAIASLRIVIKQEYTNLDTLVHNKEIAVSTYKEYEKQIAIILVEIEGLKREISLREQRISKITTEKTKIDTSIKELEVLISGKQTLISTKESELNIQIQMSAKLTKELEAIAIDIKKKQDAIIYEEAEYKKLKIDLYNKKEDLEIKQKTLKELLEKLATNQVDKKKGEATLTTTIANYEAHKKTITTKITTYTKKITKINIEIEELDKQKRASLLIIASLNKDLKEIELKIKKEEEHYASLQEDLEEVTRKKTLGEYDLNDLAILIQKYMSMVTQITIKIRAEVSSLAAQKKIAMIMSEEEEEETTTITTTIVA